MKDLILLNSKERKLILRQLTEQFGITSLPEGFVYFCFMKKEEVRIVNREAYDMEHIEKTRIHAMGMHFGTYTDDGFILSIEATQMLQGQITKNILEVTEEERNNWIEGEDLPTEDTTEHYVAIKHNTDMLGIGKVKDGKVHNLVPKNRKIKEVFTEEAS